MPRPGVSGVKMKSELILAGFGGQGIMTMGTILTTAGMLEGRHVTWFPSYGAEQRGGTANCTVVISDEEIASPIVDRPGILVAMNLPSLEKFGPMAASGGTVFVNASLVNASAGRPDIREYRIPANALAEEIGNVRVANTVVLGALAAATGLVKIDTLEGLFRESAKKRGEDFLKWNLAALAAGQSQVSGDRARP